MVESLLSVGIDVGTTTTQMVLSRLMVDNRASIFAVPELVIGKREILYRSPVHFTPLLGKDRVDGDQIRQLMTREYENAGISRADVDTGAVIITGETSRKENARAVLTALEGFAGDFVAATAGPDLESTLAARGAGAVEFSTETGKSVLHMDIGGGTSNLAWIEDGKILRTGCLNVGGRLLKFDKSGEITYISPVLDGICDLKIGKRATQSQVQTVGRMLAQALAMAAGLETPTHLLQKLWTAEAGTMWPDFPAAEVVSFSGGVADCIETEQDWLKFGDLGPVLGQQIRKSPLCAGGCRLGRETIRATVIGAGCHSVQLSGSTVFYRDVAFPLKNRPVVCLTAQEQESPELPQRIRELLARQDEDAVLYLPGFAAPSYEQVAQLGRNIAEGFGQRPILVALAADMAKALGQSIALARTGTVLCMDRVALSEGSYLDVGTPVGPSLPVVVKTLILEQ